MDRTAIFEAWAPPGGAWSSWAKPVLFAHLPRRLPEVGDLVPPDVSWAPRASDRLAIVVELPGVASVAMGLALAGSGYRPVPLFNALPAPEPDELFDPSKKGAESPSLVDVDSILAALVRGVARLGASALPDDAPPAFLLDAARRHPRRPVVPGLFDNRSVVLITDVPSAATLASRGIRGAIVVVERERALPGDLDHVLRTWARDGLDLGLKALDRPGPPRPLRLRRPNPLVVLWIRLTAWAGLRRSESGGFGDFIPESAGG